MRNEPADSTPGGADATGENSPSGEALSGSALPGIGRDPAADHAAVLAALIRAGTVATGTTWPAATVSEAAAFGLVAPDGTLPHLTDDKGRTRPTNGAAMTLAEAAARCVAGAWIGIAHRAPDGTWRPWHPSNAPVVAAEAVADRAADRDRDRVEPGPYAAARVALLGRVEAGTMPDAVGELAERGKRLVLWKHEHLPGRPKATKVPHSAGGYQASVTNSKSWATYEACAARLKAGGYDGLGYMLTLSDQIGEPEIIGIDLDNCRDTETGEIKPWAREIIARFNSYTEVSPSGRGVHIFVKGLLRGVTATSKSQGGRVGSTEVYAGKRYLTLTGDMLPGAVDEIVEAQEALDWLWREKMGKGFATCDEADPDDDVIPDAAFPKDWHDAMLELGNDSPASYIATFEHRRVDRGPDGKRKFVRADGSADLSTYDFALAVRAAQGKRSKGEAAALIRFHREHYHDSKAADRPDYVESTVNEAFRRVANDKANKKRQDAAELAEAARLAEALTPPPPQRPQHPAPFPVARFADLVVNDRSFKLAWNLERADGDDSAFHSPDGKPKLDSFAAAVAVRWLCKFKGSGEAELPALLQAFYGQHAASESASAQPDALLRLARWAVTHVADGGDDDLRTGTFKAGVEAREVREAEPGDVELSPEAEREAQARALIKSQTKLDVDRLIQVGTEPALLYLRYADGSEIKIGPFENLQRQASFQKIIATHPPRLVLSTLKRAVWENVMRAFLILVELRHEKEIDFEPEMRAQLCRHLMDHPPVYMNALDRSLTRDQIIENNRPYVENGRLNLHLDSIDRQLRSNLKADYGISDLRLFLVMNGFQPVVRSIGGGASKDRKSSSRGYWEGDPSRLALPGFEWLQCPQ